MSQSGAAIFPRSSLKIRMSDPISRRALLRDAAAAAAALVLPAPLVACTREGNRLTDPDHVRLGDWTDTLRRERLAGTDTALGRAAVRVGELAAGTPYVPHTLESYLGVAGAAPARAEPLTLSLTRFDCVTLVEACLAVARAAGGAEPTWERFGHEVERMRYRGGRREGYASRLHYFSEWITDGETRGLVKDLGAELGGRVDERPLRFMTEHRASYPALANEAVYQEIAAVERSLDSRPRRVVPTDRIAEVADRIETGDVLAFATAIPGLDVSHAAFGYRDAGGALRVLHAPLSGGVVEITRVTLPEYVAAIRRATGILIARPLRGTSS
jgi:Protein of unknown function (DUF1460)